MQKSSRLPFLSHAPPSSLRRNFIHAKKNNNKKKRPRDKVREEEEPCLWPDASLLSDLEEERREEKAEAGKSVSD